jgi:hypothetical protein
LASEGTRRQAATAQFPQVSGTVRHFPKIPLFLDRKIDIDKQNSACYNNTTTKIRIKKRKRRIRILKTPN